MKITMFVKTNISNDTRVIKEATALSQSGYQVHIIGIRRQGNEPRTETFDNISFERIDLIYLRILRWLKFLRGIPPSQSLLADDSYRLSISNTKNRRLITSIIYQVLSIVHLLNTAWSFSIAGLHNKAEIYHSNDVDTLVPALFLSRIHRKSFVYDAHMYWYEYWYKQADRPISYFFIRLIERIGAQRAAGVITVNNWIAKRMSENYRIPIPVVLMNVPSDAPLTPPLPTPDNGPIELLYLGGLSEQRGLEELIQAMLLVKEPVHLTIRGYGEIENRLKDLILSLRVEDKVTLNKPVPPTQVVEISRACQVGVIPFERDSPYYISLPNKLFEYMAAGLAIVTNNLPEISSLVQEHEMGLVYDSEDPVILAKTIDKLVGNRKRLDTYRQRSWQAFYKHYCWENHKMVLINLYDRIR